MLRARSVVLFLSLGLAVASRAEPPAAACVACEAPNAAEMRALYSEKDWARMQRADVLSEMVTTDGDGDQGRAAASGIVPAPPERIWAVLTDWESYPGFMPNAKETKLRRREGDKAWISQHLRVMWNDIRFGVIWDMEPRKGLVRFSLDKDEPHDIADTKGSWQLVPLGDGSTLVRYESSTDVGRPVAGFIQNALSKLSLPKVIRGVRDEVAARGAESEPKRNP